MAVGLCLPALKGWACSMRYLLPILCSVAVAACAHNTVPNDNRSDAFTGSVTGVIVLPDAAASATDCTQVAVYATTPDDKGAVLKVGRASVHQGSGRCSYSITDLPPGMTLTLHVEPSSGMTCGNGATLAFAAQSGASFSLKDDEARTRDFRPQCGTATSSR